MRVLDLFSAAAGGWTLGMHRAGFQTVAACEAIEWRRILYAENNPGIPIYDDVCTLTAGRLVSDLGFLPDIIVGSPPCQDISSANTKGKGVEGKRSGLFFEAVRLIGECRPRWFALENSSNLRTRGADAVLAALEGIGYACWPLVVRAGDIGANHERPRCWIIGCDVGQVTDAASVGHEGWRPRGYRQDGDCAAHSGHAAQDGRRQGLPRGRAEPASRPCLETCRDAADAAQERRQPWAGNDEVPGREEDGRESANRPACRHGVRWPWACHECDDEAWREREAPHPNGNGEHAQSEHGEVAVVSGLGADREPRNTPDPDQAGQAGQADGRMEPGLRQAEIADDGCGDGRSLDGSGVGQMAVRPADSGDTDGAWPLWSLDDLAARIRLDDGLPGRLAGTRVAVGGPRGTAAAPLIVEAYGDAVVPQIPEAIGRAILRVEAAMSAVSLPHAA